MQLVPMDEMRPGDKVVLVQENGDLMDMPEVVSLDGDTAVIVRGPRGELRVLLADVTAVIRVIPPPQVT